MFFMTLMVAVALGVLALAGLIIRLLLGRSAGPVDRLLLALSGLYALSALLAFFFSCVRL